MNISTNTKIPDLPKGWTAGIEPYWNAVWIATANPLSIGNADDDANEKGEPHNGKLVTRQITGVAAGTALTDAVNVAQLEYAIAQFSQGGGGTGGSDVHFYSVNEKSDQRGNYDNKGATGTDALAAGVDAQATGNYSVAVGNGANAPADGAVAIGEGSIATRGKGNKEGTVSTDQTTGKTTITNYGNEKTAYLKPDNLSTDSTTWVSTAGAVSVGGTTEYKEKNDNGELVPKTNLLTRQITNVAAGSDDTDAVNVAQLKAMTTEGLDFQGNNDVTVHRDLGQKLTIKGEGTKDDDRYFGENLKVFGNTDGSLTIKMDKDIKGDSVTVGEKGEPGKDGVDGRIGVNGKDGSAVVINGADGSIGLNGKDGKNGLTIKGDKGSDGTTRLIYETKDGDTTVTHETATLDDGLKFKGDDDKVITKKLNEQLDIVGGAQGDLTDKNIAVKSTEDGKLKVQMAKNLTDLTSVTTGNTTIDNGGMTIKNDNKDKTIVINDGNITLGGNQVNNMGSGSDGVKNGKPTYNTLTNGANIGDVKNIAGQMSSDLTTEGLNFQGNNTDVTVHRDLGQKLTIKGEGTKDDDRYFGENLKVFGNTDGSLTIKMDKDIKGESVTVDRIGLNGKDGKDGLTIKGTDGKDGTTRIVYETKEGEKTVDHDVATLDDGLKFVGNDSNVVARKLNETLSITGGITDKDTLKIASGKNLGVLSNKKGDGLEIVMTNRPDFEAITVGPDGGSDHKIIIGQQDNKEGNPNPAKGNYITGLNNTTWNKENVVADRAATEGQLSQAISDIKGGDNGGFGLADEKGGAVKKDLGQTITVKGDGKNIETKVNNGALEVSLKKDVNLTKEGSIKAGDTTINKEGITTNQVKVGDITITENGIDGGKKQITNIASGIDGNQYKDAKDNNAASIGDIRKITSETTDAAKLIGDRNITVTYNDSTADGKNTVKLNDSITLGNDADKKVIINGTAGIITAGDKVSLNGNTGIGNIGGVTIGNQNGIATTQKDGDSYKTEDGTFVTGLTNKTWNPDANGIVSGRAATEDQLKMVSDKVNSGRVFQGDDGQSVTVGMGETLNLKGGAKEVSSADNIGIVKGNDNILNIRLAKDIKGINSIEANTITTGNTTIDNSGLTVKTGDSNHQNITIQQGNVNMGGNKIEGVAPGKVVQNSTDAVNGGQLWQRDQVINGLGGAVNKLGSRINRVGAGAAALAALHPLDFDPDDKWDFAAGYGNYRGANAAAVGAYYRPNEDTMFSIGGSFGGGENMVNAGVSFKLGQGNHVSTSRVAMAKEIKELRQNVASLNAIVNRQSALIDKLTGTNAGTVSDTGNDLFPDVPANHWAYEYVSKLKQAGLLTGYPDGNFDGDRMMTRYEFAAVIYRAIMAGAASNPALNQDGTLDKLAKEFSPEMKYIRIDTIAKDKNDKPTIERVRVIPDAK